MTRILAVIAAVVVLAATAAAQGQPVRLTILHTSEHHGNLPPFDTRAERGVGGVAARATVIAQVRQEAPNVLLLDSGDILLGTTMSSVFRGEPDILAMNLMGYDAMAAATTSSTTAWSTSAGCCAWRSSPSSPPRSGAGARRSRRSS